MSNIDEKTVAGFGDEWSRFDQTGMTDEEANRIFNNYFSLFPWHQLPPNAVGFDLGCGSGRWAKHVAPRVGTLHCIDPSKALEVAEKNLAIYPNCKFHKAGSDDIPLPNDSMDFGYSLGVLHHIPDTKKAMQDCIDKLKPGAPFLVYLYYAFDNRPFWFKYLWKTSELLRAIISKMPHGMRYFMSQIIAFTVYFPLARFAKYAEKIGINAKNFPLYAYRNTTFYTMRTDALDRFGTRLEQRFTKKEITEMMQSCGLEDIQFVPDKAFWTAVGIKSKKK